MSESKLKEKTESKKDNKSIINELNDTLITKGDDNSIILEKSDYLEADEVQSLLLQLMKNCLKNRLIEKNVKSIIKTNIDKLKMLQSISRTENFDNSPYQDLGEIYEEVEEIAENYILCVINFDADIFTLTNKVRNKHIGKINDYIGDVVKNLMLHHTWSKRYFFKCEDGDKKNGLSAVKKVIKKYIAEYTEIINVKEFAMKKLKRKYDAKAECIHSIMSKKNKHIFEEGSDDTSTDEEEKLINKILKIDKNDGWSLNQRKELM